MSDSPSEKTLREGLDKKLIRIIGYKATCIISAAMLGTATKTILYGIQCIDFSKNIDGQLSVLEHLLEYIKFISINSLLAGAFVGLAISLTTSNLKPNFLRILINSFLGAIIYLLSEWAWRFALIDTFKNSIDYLRFFGRDLVIVGFTIGLLISFLPFPDKATDAK